MGRPYRLLLSLRGGQGRVESDPWSTEFAAPWNPPKAVDHGSTLPPVSFIARRAGEGRVDPWSTVLAAPWNPPKAVDHGSNLPPSAFITRRAGEGRVDPWSTEFAAPWNPPKAVDHGSTLPPSSFIARRAGEGRVDPWSTEFAAPWNPPKAVDHGSTLPACFFYITRVAATARPQTRRLLEPDTREGYHPLDRITRAGGAMAPGRTYRRPAFPHGSTTRGFPGRPLRDPGRNSG